MYLKIVNRFLFALSFLTLLPLKLKIEKFNEREISSSVVFFPFIGLLEGAFCVLLVSILKETFSSSVISLVLLLFLFSLRGIFHIDGLSDTFDALFYKSTEDREKNLQRRLNILKDSTVGVAGLVAVVVDILCRFVFVREIIELNLYTILPFALCFSRWTVIPLMYYGKAARVTGLGALFIGKITSRQGIISTLLPTFLMIYFVFGKNLVFLIPLVSLICFIIFVLKGLFERNFGGLTGDHLGATIEITEISFLFFYLVFVKIWQSF